MTAGRSNATDSLSVFLPGGEWADPAWGIGSRSVAGPNDTPPWDGRTPRGHRRVNGEPGREKAGSSNGFPPSTPLPFEGPLLGAMPSKVAIFATTAKGRVKGPSDATDVVRRGTPVQVNAADSLSVRLPRAEWPTRQRGAAGHE